MIQVYYRTAKLMQPLLGISYPSIVFISFTACAINLACINIAPSPQHVKVFGCVYQ